MLSATLLFLSGQDTIVILIVALVLFGGKKLPELARGLGQGIREFKDASEGVKRDIQEQINKETTRTESPVAAAVTVHNNDLVPDHSTPINLVKNSDLVTDHSAPVTSSTETAAPATHRRETPLL